MSGKNVWFWFDGSICVKTTSMDFFSKTQIFTWNTDKKVKEERKKLGMWGLGVGGGGGGGHSSRQGAAK